MAGRFKGPQAALARLEGLVATHGAVLIEKDPRGFRIVLADAVSESGDTTWCRDEPVGSTLANAVAAAAEASR